MNWEYRIEMTCGRHAKEKGTAKEEISRYAVRVQLDSGRWIAAKYGEFEVLKEETASLPKQTPMIEHSAPAETHTVTTDERPPHDFGKIISVIAVATAAVWWAYAIASADFGEPPKECKNAKECTERLNWVNDRKVPQISKRSEARKAELEAAKEIDAMNSEAAALAKKINSF